MGAKKKELKSIPYEPSSEQSQIIDNIFIPQNSKETEIIDTDVDQAVERVYEILKSEIKVL